MIPIGDENPTRRFAFFNTIFIIGCIALFVLGLFSREFYVFTIERFAMIPSVFFSDPIGNWYRPFTGVFLHGGILHVLGNMLFLFIFGDNIEDVFGHIRYVFFFLLTGGIASLAQAVFMPGLAVPIVGASGAISGIIVAYMLLFPMKNIQTIILLGFIPIPVKIPSFIYILIWVAGQVLATLGSFGADWSRGGVAYMAHAGGIITGFLYGIGFKKKLKRRGMSRF